MYEPGGVCAPASASQALEAVRAGLDFLAAANAAELTAAEQADCLRGLAAAESVHLAATTRILKAFDSAEGYAADGQRSAKAWLRWQTRVTRPAAGAVVAWMRRLVAHPAIAGALAEARLSPSFARQICEWTDQLAEEHRADADKILLDAAIGGAELSDLAALFEEIRARTARPDTDGEDRSFASRSLILDTHYQGNARLDGDLTPQAAAALAAVLDSLGKKAGPEDVRSKAQRRHDALEEVCRRLIASGCLPGRAGQPLQIQLGMTLSQLAGQPEADPALAAWIAANGLAAPPGADCDASIVPVVTGNIDPDVLDQLAQRWLDQLLPGQQPTASLGTDADGQGGPDASAEPGPQAGPDADAAANADAGPDASPKLFSQSGPDADAAANPQAEPTAEAAANAAAGRDMPAEPGPEAGPDGEAAANAAARADRIAYTARQLTIAEALRLLSGPSGLAAALRAAGTSGAAAAVSLPLDIGAATETIPAQIRRAIIRRDQHCQFPGCDTPAAACHVHHLVPKSEGGTTSVGTCGLFCSFHHLIAIHRWGWQVTMNADGTTTATLGSVTLHSHTAAA